jgi:hypothetical protein
MALHTWEFGLLVDCCHLMWSGRAWWLILQHGAETVKTVPRLKYFQRATVAVQPIPVPPDRFSHVHVDLVWPLPVAADGSRYLFTMGNRSSRWLEAVPLKKAEKGSCVDSLIDTWIARTGVPVMLTSDKGQQFTSQV